MRPTINQMHIEIQNQSKKKENKLTKRLNPIFGDNIAKLDIYKQFVWVIFDREHHKCDRNRNTTRGLIQ